MGVNIVMFNVIKWKKWRHFFLFLLLGKKMCQQKKTKFDSFLGQWNVLEREHKIIFGHFLKYKQQKLHNELLYIADQ